MKSLKKELALLGGLPTITEPGPHAAWPRITENLERALIRQLHTGVSIYDKSGIIEEFEGSFASYHSRAHGLLANSGTSAIHAMYEGIGLGPGDEVICPVYTFFASVGPLMHTGASPVFCDCTEAGNIDPAEIEKRITPRTRAVVVTHMWGVPCDMEPIVALCKANVLRLLEDCSHAHGAIYRGRKVGTFGDAAAWSLQGQKIVTGGEGGILLTDDAEIYYRALLQGHYNKRCKQEIPNSHSLAQYSTTGMGLKFRAHPLAIAMAAEQFSHLDEWLIVKRANAAKMTASFRQFPFLRNPLTGPSAPAWYAYVMQFDESAANGVSLDLFAQAVQAEGLAEFDLPRSTAPLTFMPLFHTPDQVLPRLYEENLVQSQNDFPQAERFYCNAMKLPVWAFEDESPMVEQYIEGIVKVADAVARNPEKLLDFAAKKL